MTIIEAREGVGLNKLQFTTTILMSFGLTLVLEKRSSSAPNITYSTSFLAAAMEGVGGMLCILREISLFSKARAFKNLSLKVKGGLVEVPIDGRVKHEFGEWNFEMRWGL